MNRTSAHDSGSQVLLIGLDSADAELIDQWCQAGYLPNIERLRKQGVWGDLGTTAEVMHVSAWPSIYTGTHPGKHGMYHAYQITAGEQNVHRTLAEECAQLPFWKFLDDAGRRCIVMDAFMDYRLENFKGIQILEYGTWTWFTEPKSTPNGLYKEIVRRFGRYPAPEHTLVLDVPEPRRFRDQLIAGAQTKARVVKWLLKEKPWGMAFVTFGEPHAAGHYLWHVSDETYVAHNCPDPELRTAMRDVYAAVDAAIGEIVDSLDDSVTVMVTSGDGMGPNYAGCHLMPEVLHKLGLYFSANVGGADAGQQGAGQSAPKKSVLAAVREAIPLSVRQSISRCLPRSLHYKLSMKWANADIDWTRSRVFTIPNANEGYLRVNLTGREPEGIVGVGSEYHALLDELRREIAQLVNPLNGHHAVDRIHLTDSVFPGERRQNLPDVVVTWDVDAKVLAELASDSCGVVHKKANYETAPYYTGNHRPRAFVVARGPGISAGAVLENGHIIDIAPTILAMLGVEPPAHFDGQIWGEFLGEPAQARNVSLRCQGAAG